MLTPLLPLTSRRAQPTQIITKLSATMVVPDGASPPPPARTRSLPLPRLSPPAVASVSSSAATTAPKNPGSSPAFWFGVQTEKGDGALVQPIMAKELGYEPGKGSSFYMLQEIFDWTAENDTQVRSC